MRIRTSLIFVTIFLVVASLVSFSQSQPPPPTPLKTSQEQQNKAEPKQTESKSIQNIPDKPPLVAEVIPTPSTDPEKANITKQGDEKPTTYGWKFTFDALLVFFSGVLAISTALLWYSTRQLWKSTEKSIDLAYKAFIATNRPRLRIRHIQFEGFSKTDILPTWVYITNIGGSAATDIVFHAVFALRTGSIRIPPWIENLLHIPGHGPFILAPGEGRIPYEPRTKIDFAIGDYGKIMAGEKTLLIIGKVRYRDANQMERETGFGWAYDPGTGEFSKPEKDDQYNYED